ncbi:TonB-dependent lactoferrin/transferrin receptor/TonB-dependent hemoglobin/transferrin/lactoferrin receptor [Bisgaardia hudsonensis]|uniref:TonB-dependent lactoferrin/transferrin receptor/TonB-dependent hemoglobin/transferrin/lactoferrin receptor n=1 Tax=Bisgaardia hudsonensis TaxID=109472 RepID=A0A4R2N2W5_9PAST|nr:lactoferrin/transferrin family TonB-dependent receptor [Bisgaardia hudsonensis]QLB12600.1 hypothetical protein A6A11_02765 [Bisgaardia hudsonensis]TCP14142.1 TonB-dependent lactoferrin/transferrin receptor/TonB-dependent hemoglobin/transferrin/lactoferrin receptor [Bisgaardia hudsonensis]
MLNKKIALSFIITAFYGYYGIAAETQLSDVYIQGAKKVHKKSTELTGLGKVVKNSQDLEKEMVLNIRDLTRYDPGIDVVEQGRGASSGYSIRGMDKNRVGITVDGIPQLSHYKVEQSGKYAANDIFSGAINEVEYENIKSIEISKGASSSDFGSGSLGGNIKMRTKNADDIIQSGKSWGTNLKSAYSSKNRNFTNSVAFATRHKNADFLLIHTQKKGNETAVHKDVLDESYDVTHSRYYLVPKDYDEAGNVTKDDVTRYYVLEDENGHRSELIPDVHISPSNIVYDKIKLNPPIHKTDRIGRKLYHVCNPENCSPEGLKASTPYPEGEQNNWPYWIEYELDRSNPKVVDIEKSVKEKIAAKDYTGTDSPVPDKLDYGSKSTLVKLGYQLESDKRFGVVYENTEQKYNIRDMRTPAFWASDDEKLKKKSRINPHYHSINAGDNLIIPISMNFGRLGYNENNRLKDPTNPVVIRTLPYGGGETREFLYLPSSVLKDGERIRQYGTEWDDGKEYLVVEGASYPNYGKVMRRVEIKAGEEIRLTDSEAAQSNDGGRVRTGTNYRYTRLRFIDEQHNKERIGVNYQQKDMKFLDDLELAYDFQRIKTKTTEYNLNCSVYPKVDKNCRASMKNPYSYYETQTHIYKEEHHIVKLDMNKAFNTGSWKHRLNMLVGYDVASAHTQRTNYFSENAVLTMKWIGGEATKADPHIRKIDKGRSGIFTNLNCGDSIGLECVPYNLTSKNLFIGFNDKIKINRYLDLGLGLRYDQHKVNSKEGWKIKANYENLSWNIGTVVKPVKNVFLSYRVSSGFRVPSFHEHFGYTPQRKFPYSSRNLSPERVVNQEYGLGFYGDFGSLEVNYYRNKYKDLIITSRYTGLDVEKDEAAGFNYRNAENAILEGINIYGRLDFNGVYNKIPEGLYSTFHFNKIKVKNHYYSALNKESTENGKVVKHELDALGSSFEAIQPSKFTLGLGYDSPDEKWGMQAIMVHSKAKKLSEIISTRSGLSVVNNLPKAWTTYDLIGYYKPLDSITLRAGVFNIFNKRYTTWSSMRQVSQNATHNLNIGNYGSLTSPGRNFSLTIEAKF